MAGHQATPPPPKPSTTHSCESSRAEKTLLRKRPDGEQMTAKNKELMKVVTRFPRATTSAIEASTVHTYQHELESRTKSTSGSLSFFFTWKLREIRPRAPRNCRRTCIHCRTKRCEETYQLHVRKLHGFLHSLTRPTENCWKLLLQFTGTSTTIPCTCEVSTVFCTVLHCAYSSLHTTGMCGTL